MDELIRRLDAWLRRHRPDFYATLLPGLRPSELNAFAKAVAVRLPEQFRQLYSWRNGQSSDDSRTFLDGNTWLNLAAVRSEWVLLSEIRQEIIEDGDLNDDTWFRPTWLPFLDSGGGDDLCVDVGGSFGGTPGQLIPFSHEGDNRVIEYPSLERWLGIVVESLEAGLWREVEGHLTPANEAKLKKFIKARNPGYPIIADDNQLLAAPKIPLDPPDEAGG